jgi:hypothetical protein
MSPSFANIPILMFTQKKRYRVAVERIQIDRRVAVGADNDGGLKGLVQLRKGNVTTRPEPNREARDAWAGARPCVSVRWKRTELISTRCFCHLLQETGQG